MTQWGLDTLFNPAKRHMDEEKRRLQSTREEIGDSSGGKRIDLESGKVTISRGQPKDDDTTEATTDEATTDEATTDEAITDEATTDEATTELGSVEPAGEATEGAGDARAKAEGGTGSHPA